MASKRGMLAMGLLVFFHVRHAVAAICGNWDIGTCENQTDGGCKCVWENSTSTCSKSDECSGFGVTGAGNMTTTSTVSIGSDGNTTTTTMGLTRTMVDILGQSGKFTIYDERRGKATGIQVTMDALREVDSTGQPVGTSGSVKHSIETFAAQEFAIAPAEDVTLEDGNVSAVKVSFSSSISSIGTIRVDTYVLGKSGVLGPPGEKWSVQPGDLKWNIALSNWTWCGCKKGQQSEEGAFIDLEISVKGLTAMEVKGNKSLSLGDGATLELSDQVYADGTWSAMPEGYPKITVQGSSTTFTFRFPKFETSSLYDPLITGLSTGEAVESTTRLREGAMSGSRSSYMTVAALSALYSMLP
eukprot:TRINITY_DN19705_c0_g1_i1.p1 TRINITY_DN19705_c0_g1~~TRINITY_DN19705_c0_g1_i1.p1  ORF type:complete len:356 (-),score=68.82 TRINITY_DN19705_c0_g1_i1:139-1206(-)